MPEERINKNWELQALDAFDFSVQDVGFGAQDAGFGKGLCIYVYRENATCHIGTWTLAFSALAIFFSWFRALGLEGLGFIAPPPPTTTTTPATTTPTTTTTNNNNYYHIWPL